MVVGDGGKVCVEEARRVGRVLWKARQAGLKFMWSGDEAPSASQTVKVVALGEFGECFAGIQW